MSIEISALYIYPVKSCRGIEVQGCRLDFRGPQLDRRFMVVDEQGVFVTQREAPKLALVTPSLAPTALQLDAPGMQRLSVPLSGSGELREVRVWGFEGDAIDAGHSASRWFSELLDRPARLVRFAEHVMRPVSKRHTDLDAQVGFSDGYPVLLISEASLADLNNRLQTPVTMDRFRPNLVVRGCEAYAEDGWKRVRAPEMLFDVVKPCDRCAIVTVDQHTATTSKEPLATLATYRSQDNKVLFGQNLVHHGLGAMRVGDKLQVEER